jgi:polygalacturonase
MRTVKIFLLLLFTILGNTCSQNINNADSIWQSLPGVIQKITTPVFPQFQISITDFGAVGDGKTDCTESFKKAIDSCANKGGGTVLVPEGIFLTGTIHLRSNINLHLAENSVIKFSTDPQKYLPIVFTRWEGVECMNYSPLIYAYGQENIAITGNGILDGQGSNSGWWSWKGKKEFGWHKDMPDQNSDRDKLFEMGENNTPTSERIFGEGHFLRPNFFQPYKCKNVLVEGVIFKNSPMWFLHPVLCENVSFIKVTVEGLGPNNDGCDPESSTNVLIEGCNFNTGDDCIAIKSGRNNDGRRINVPSENIIIKNCKMKEGHGGVVIGSETSGGIKNIFAENCVMNSPDLDRAIRIKTNAVRGGIIENIYVRDIKIGEVKEAVLKINFFYEEGENGSFIPKVRNVFLNNITSEKSKYAVWIKAFENSPAENIHISNCIFKNAADENMILNVSGLKVDSVMINNSGWKLQ